MPSKNIIKIRVGNITYNVNAEGYEPFWDKVVAGQYEPTTLKLIDASLGPNKLFIDGGGWIGLTTLAAASKGAQVVVYEPNPVAVEFLKANISLNPGFKERIHIREAALDTAHRKVNLFNNHPKGFRNTRSTLAVANGQSITVDAIDIQSAVRSDNWNKAALIKIDVEGHEYSLIPSMCAALSQRKPPVLIEFHPHHLTHDSSFKKKVAATEESLAPWTSRAWSEHLRLTPINGKPFSNLISEIY